jgi:hypothetical protein
MHERAPWESRNVYNNGDLLRKVDRLNENIYLKKNENIYLNSLDPDGSISTDFSPGKIL